jgi:hypothetical protein
MRSLFNPAVALMSRFNFGLKFAISGLVDIALLIYVGLLEVSNQHDRASQLWSELAAASLMTLVVDWNRVLIERRRIAVLSDCFKVMNMAFGTAALCLKLPYKHPETCVPIGFAGFVGPAAQYPR